MKNLLILGAGQYGMVAKEIADSMSIFNCISFLDDNNPIAVGKLNEYARFINKYDSAVVAIGDAAFRLKYIEQLEAASFEIPVLIHEKSYVSPSAVVGKGSFIEPMAVVHTDVTISTGCIISTGTVVNHNAVIGDGCHLNCGTIIGAGVHIANCKKTNYGSVIHE